MIEQKPKFVPALARKSKQYRRQIYIDMLNYFDDKRMQVDKRNKWQKLFDWVFSIEHETYYPTESNISLVKVMNKLYDGFPNLDSEEVYISYHFPELAEEGVELENGYIFYNDRHRITALNKAITELTDKNL